MERRVLDIAVGHRYLSKKCGSLVITRDPGTPQASVTLVPFDEIESVIVHTPQASYSNAALVELSRRCIPVVCCDTAHMPVAWLWPAVANFEQARRMAAQAAMPDELREALWARIVRAKIEAQAAAVRAEGASYESLFEFALAVRPGDRGNVEAQAARLYWKLVFDESFRRDRYGDPPNSLLNYGYTILRATVARHLCAAGLNPSLGLYHHNRFNAFCLADDLMEVFRPEIDRTVVALWRENHQTVTTETKPILAAVMAKAMSTERGIAPLSRCIEWVARSLAQSIVHGDDRLKLPNAIAATG
ncbi:MAG: type II CRISPR-associated endonuclease Cas1 [Acidimicrobiaceae bacterium]|nr:type II CRISPR-associated endonuclease Cas1 [Acidimicrobiaceae bacterium]